MDLGRCIELKKEEEEGFMPFTYPKEAFRDFRAFVIKRELVALIVIVTSLGNALLLCFSIKLTLFCNSIFFPRKDQL